MSSEADKPGMTLDQLQAAVEHARRSGATGNELVRARLFGRRGGLRSIALDLEEPLLAEPGAKSGKGQSDLPPATGHVQDAGSALPAVAVQRGADRVEVGHVVVVVQ